MYKKSIVYALGMTLLAACGAPKPRTLPSAPAALPAPAGPGVYRIDAAASELRLLVYRAGPAARLGHNHVIVNHSVGGWIKFTGDKSAAAFTLSVPVAEFVIDDPAARNAEGADFSEEVSPDAKDGTRGHMLSPALLDGERFPSITLTRLSVTPSHGEFTAIMRVSVAGHESTISVPFNLDTSAGQIVATGSTNLRQSALGLTPFSVMLGALRVQDEFTVKFKFVAY